MTIEVSSELKPNSKQQEVFLGLPAGENGFWEAFYGGEAGSGKTFSIVTLPLFLRCHDIFGFRATIYRRSFPQINESLVPESRKWYGKFGFRYNESDHVWKHPRTKAEIAFGFIEHEKDVFKHDSAQYHYLAFEELTQFTEFMYKYLLHRNRSDIAGWDAICRSVGTPGDIGNTWVKKRFVYPCREGMKPIEYSLPNGKIGRRIFIKARRDDNIDLIKNDPSYGDRLELLPSEALKRAKKYGDWDAFQGQVFTEFRTYHHPDEPDNAIHVVQPYEIPDWWPKLIAIDWGYLHNTWVGWGAVSPSGKLVIYREYAVNQTKIKVWGPHVKRLSSDDGNIRRIVGDPSGFRNIGLERTIADQMMEATDWVIEEADNDRIGGKMLLHELMRWEKAPPSLNAKEGFDPEYASRLMRMKGDEAYHEYCIQYMPEEVNESLPKLEIFDNCQMLIDSLMTVTYNNKSKSSNINEEDVKKVDGDDPYDGLRYLAKAYERFIGMSGDEYGRRLEVQGAIDKLLKSGDYYAFNNQMDEIEALQESRSNRGYGKYKRIRRHSSVVH
jgi:hypothetical protein